MTDKPTRKVIQLTATGVHECQFTQCEMMLFALCDDGTVWGLENRRYDWQPLPQIPQTPIGEMTNDRQTD